LSVDTVAQPIGRFGAVTWSKFSCSANLRMPVSRDTDTLPIKALPSLISKFSVTGVPQPDEGEIVKVNGRETGGPPAGIEP
jgi:hypothetical protein